MKNKLDNLEPGEGANGLREVESTGAAPARANDWGQDGKQIDPSPIVVDA